MPSGFPDAREAATDPLTEPDQGVGSTSTKPTSSPTTTATPANSHRAARLVVKAGLPASESDVNPDWVAATTPLTGVAEGQISAVNPCQPNLHYHIFVTIGSTQGGMLYNLSKISVAGLSPFLFQQRADAREAATDSLAKPDQGVGSTRMRGQ